MNVDIQVSPLVKQMNPDNDQFTARAMSMIAAPAAEFMRNEYSKLSLEKQAFCQKCCTQKPAAKTQENDGR
jgi:hypothetical protein